MIAKMRHSQKLMRELGEGDQIYDYRLGWPKDIQVSTFLWSNKSCTKLAS